jgi:predicted dehydrogenase
MVGTRGHYGYLLDRLSALPHVQLVAASPGGDSLEALDKWAAANGRTFEPFDDYRTMLDRARPDAAALCGPFETHAAMCIECLDRGIHVLTEKPAALTEEELAALVDAVERNPRVHLAGMMASRYDAGFYNASKLIDSGAIGEVRLINVRKSYKLGKRPSFFADRQTYGGTIPWVGSHAIDWAMWYAGDARARSVFATHSAQHNGNNGTMERSAACLFTFDRDITATVSIDVFRPDSAPTHGDDWARVVGTEGVVEARPAGVTLLDANGEQTIATPADRELIGDFFDHVRGAAHAVIDARSTIELTRLCLAARRSADEGRMVML